MPGLVTSLQPRAGSSAGAGTFSEATVGAGDGTSETDSARLTARIPRTKRERDTYTPLLALSASGTTGGPTARDATDAKCARSRQAMVLALARPLSR